MRILYFYSFTPAPMEPPHLITLPVHRQLGVPSGHHGVLIVIIRQLAAKRHDEYTLILSIHLYPYISTVYPHRLGAYQLYPPRPLRPNTWICGLPTCVCGSDVRCRHMLGTYDRTAWFDSHSHWTRHDGPWRWRDIDTTNVPRLPMTVDPRTFYA